MSRQVFVMLSVVSILFLGACMPIQAPSVQQAEATPSPIPVVIESVDEVPRITLAEAKQHFDDGTAIFVDARSEASYTRGHIAGAVYFSDEEIPALGDTLPKEMLLITYCT